MAIEFKDKVAIVTGAGVGLGRSHALELAKRGAKVVVNDLGGSVDGSGGSASAAEQVALEIEKLGGTALADQGSVSDRKAVEQMVQKTLSTFGRVDILVNNAGILRDKSFSKMELDDFQTVMDVHLNGSVNCTKAVWDVMKEQNYGRIAMTTSSSGLYGNFGQSNYGAAKLALVGFMNTLKLEGAKYNIRVNSLAPTAATRMTKDLIPGDVGKAFDPQLVTPGLLFIVSENAPNGVTLCAGAGCFSVSRVLETDGVFLGREDVTPEKVEQRWSDITDDTEQAFLEMGSQQSEKFYKKVLQHFN